MIRLLIGRLMHEGKQESAFTIIQRGRSLAPTNQYLNFLESIFKTIKLLINTINSFILILYMFLWTNGITAISTTIIPDHAIVLTSNH